MGMLRAWKVSTVNRLKQAVNGETPVCLQFVYLFVDDGNVVRPLLDDIAVHDIAQVGISNEDRFIVGVSTAVRTHHLTDISWNNIGHHTISRDPGVWKIQQCVVTVLTCTKTRYPRPCLLNWLFLHFHIDKAPVYWTKRLQRRCDMLKAPDTTVFEAFHENHRREIKSNIYRYKIHLIIQLRKTQIIATG